MLAWALSKSALNASSSKHPQKVYHQWDLQWPPHCLPPRHPHPICYPTPLVRNSNSSDCHYPNLSTARILRPLPRNQHLSSPQLSFTGVRLLRTWPGQAQDTKPNHERSHPAKATSSLLALLRKPALCQHKPGGESGAPNHPTKPSLSGYRTQMKTER